MRKRLIIFLLILFQATIWGLSTNFNKVRNNKLDIMSYSFENFLYDFNQAYQFMCVDDNPFNAEYKSVYEIMQIDKELEMTCTLKKKNSDEQILLDSSNFDDFRKSFILDECLDTIDEIPIRFLKVKTSAQTEDLTFYNNTNGNAVNDKAANSNVVYYAYKIKNVGTKKFVYLGIQSKAFPLNIPQKQQQLLGWVLYEDNGVKQNVVLWNTNIGLKPNRVEDGTSKSYVFYEKDVGSALRYAASGVKPVQDELLVNENGLQNYFTRFIEKNGCIHRWLPMYKPEGYQDDRLVKIGVIEEEGYTRSSLISGSVVQDKVQLILLVDATNSMKPVWQNLDKLLMQMMKDLFNANLENAVGEKIKPRIKIYYFTDKPYQLNSEWFESIDDIEKYKQKIASIALKSSDHYLPDISKAIDFVIKKESATPFYMTVIGDAGDHDYPDLPAIKFPSVIDRLKENYVGISGLLFKSEWPNKRLYKQGLEVFKKNFDIISTEDKIISQESIANTSKKITKHMITDIKGLVEQGEAIILNQEVARTGNAKNLSVFAKAYLKNMADKLQSLTHQGKGTYFEEGIVSISNNKNIFERDILITEEKVVGLLSTLRDLRNQTTHNEFKRTIRKLLMTFFEIDFTQVDDAFLANTTLFDLWSIIVGDPIIANQLLPEFFESDVSFNYIIQNWDDHREQLYSNSSQIYKKLEQQVREEKSRWVDVTATESGIGNKIAYYWVSANDIMLFKGINF